MNFEQLARESGVSIDSLEWQYIRGTVSELLQRFDTMGIAQEHTRLLEGSGEPYGIWHDGETEDESDFYLYAQSGDVACSDCIKLYTADQMAAAVLRGKREAITDAYLLVKLLKENSTDYIIDRLSDMVEATEPRAKK